MATTPRVASCGSVELQGYNPHVGFSYLMKTKIFLVDNTIFICQWPEWKSAYKLVIRGAIGSNPSGNSVPYSVAFCRSGTHEQTWKNTPRSACTVIWWRTQLHRLGNTLQSADCLWQMSLKFFFKRMAYFRRDVKSC